MEDGTNNRSDIPWNDFGKEVERIIVGEGITRIGNIAFVDMSVVDVVLPETLTEIGVDAFAYDDSLVNINIPKNVKRIEDYAFTDCIALENIEIPKNVNYIGKYAIGYQYDTLYGYYCKMESVFMYTNGSANAVATSYSSENGVPYFNNDNTNADIGNGISCKYDFVNGILTISGSGKLSNFNVDFSTDYVKKVIVEEGITELGRYSFSIRNAETVILPDSLKVIDEYAIYGTSKLKKINIPKNVESIGEIAIGGALEEAVVDPANAYFTSYEGVIYDKKMENLILYPVCKTSKSYTTPDTLVGINRLTNSYLKSITLGENVKELQIYSFYCCYSLTSLTFLGDAPILSVDMLDKINSNYRVYLNYYGSKARWEATKFKCRKASNINWVDIEYDYNATKISKTSMSISAGDFDKVTLTNTNNRDIVFESSNPAVAMVTGDGKVYGLKSGTATISAHLEGMTKIYNCSVTVSGNTSSDKYEYQKFDSEESKKVLKAIHLFQCSNPEGFYYFYEKTLYFHSVILNKELEMYTWQNMSRYFFQNNKIYVMSIDNGTTIYSYDICKQKVVSEKVYDCDSPYNFGVDKNENVFFVDSERVYLFDKEGNFKSSCRNEGGGIVNFLGFDYTNGNFYVEKTYNWRYWGYNHNTYAVYAGNYSSGKITLSNSVMCVGAVGSLQDALLQSNDLVLHQCDFSPHYGSAQVYGDRYLIATSSLFGKTFVVDSNKTNISDYAYCILQTQKISFDSAFGLAYSIGPGCAYSEKDGQLYAYVGNKEIEQLDMETGDTYSTMKLKNYYFYMYTIGDVLYVVERDDENVYLEKISLAKPNVFAIEGASTVKAMGNIKLSVKSDSNLNEAVSWSSSNTKVATIDSRGNIKGIKPGTVTITCTCISNGMKDTKTITVTENKELTKEKTASYKIDGTPVENIGMQNYSVWADTMDSFIYQKGNGDYVRVFHSDAQLFVETYGDDCKLKDSKLIALELDLWGGFYHTDKYNFVVIGQKNEKEADNEEVYRIIKYDQNFKQLGSCSIDGANTYMPFDAGSCRMAECDGKLYVYTCHEMYSSGDGYHHQANVTLVIDIATMNCVDGFFDVMNESYGYVSHSFNQFIVTEGNNIYRADHGDASPRGLYISVTDSKSDVINPYIHGGVLGVAGYGNATGMSLGGFEKSRNGLLYAINSADRGAEEYDCSGNRGIYISYVDLDSLKTKFIPIVKYTNSSKYTASTPQLVKIDNDFFVLMWEEKNASTRKHVSTKCVALDSEGNMVSDILKLDMRLSDCQPIVNKSGMIVWYTSDEETIKINFLNPRKLTDGKESSASAGKKGTLSLDSAKKGIKLEWTRDAAATGYYIYRKSGSEAYKLLTKLSGSNITSYTDKSAKNGISYYYQIKKYAGAQTYVYTDAKSYIYLKSTKATVKKAKNGIKISWKKNTKAKGYYVYRKLGKGTWQKIAKVNKKSKYYIDKKAKKKKTYTYAVVPYSGKCLGYKISSKKVKR